MSSIDERVVKMTFDNDDFEKDIQTSSESLSKFKDSLNDSTTATGLDNVSKSLSNISFTSVLSGIENMTSKFSVFGVSAATVIQDITRKLESMAETMVTAITTDPLTAGWDEYELKMSSVAVIMNSTGESIDTVNQYLDELNEYADQTIYSFSDMTENIGKFTNAGVSLEDAVTAIRGISNEAALSGATATQASNAMYNFAQALSTGYVALIDWKSIENAQMATQEFKQQLLDTAVACGTVEETADGMYQVLTTNASGSTLSDAINATEGFRDSLSYQWLTTEVLIETLKDYGDATTEIGAKASEAATEVKTFSMLIDTLKEAMGSGWTETWENIFGDYETAKAGWTSVSNLLGNIIDNSATKRNLKVSEAMNTTWSLLQQKFVDAGVSAEDFNSTMTELAINTGLVTQDMIDSMGGLENTISEGWLTTDLLNDAISSLFGTTSSDAEEATEALSDYKDIVTEIIRGTYGNSSDRKSALEELGYDYEALQTIVDAVWDGSEINWDNYTEEALIAAGATEEEAEALIELKDSLDITDEELQQFVDDLNSGKKGGTELLWESITNTIEGLSRILGSIGSAWTNVFGNLSSGTIYNIIASIESFTEKLLINEETARNLQRTFRGLFSVLSIIKTTVTTIASRTFKALSSVLGDLDIDILSITGKIGNAIDKFRLWYESSDVVNKVIDAMVPLVKLAGSAVKELVSQLKSIPQVQSVITAIKNAFSGLDNEIQNGFPTLQKWVNKLVDMFSSLKGVEFKTLKDTLKDLFTSVENGDIKFKFPNLYKLADTFPNIAETIRKAFSKLNEVITSFTNSVGDGSKLEGVAENATTVFEAIGNAFNTIGDAVGSGLSKINIGSILSIAVTIGSLVSAFQLLSSVKQFGNAAQSVGGFFDSLSELVKKVGTTSSDVTETVTSTTGSSATGIQKFRSIVISLGILAAAIIAIGKQPVEDLEKAGICLAAMAGVILIIQAISGLLSKKGLSGSLKGNAGTMIALSASLLIIIQALKQLNGIAIDDSMSSSLLIVGGIIIALAAACWIIQSNATVLDKGQKSTSKMAVIILAFAVAIKAIVSALKDLTKIDYSYSDITVLAGMVAALIAACVLLSNLGSNLSVGTAASLIALPAALLVFVYSLEKLAGLKYDTIASAIPKLIIIMTEMIALAAISKLSGSTTKATSLLAMASSIVIIAAAMQMLSTINSNDMTKAIVALEYITLSLAALMAVSNATTKVATKGSKLSSGILSMIGIVMGIVTLTAALIILSQLDESKLANAEVALITISGCFALIEGFSAFTGSGSLSNIVALGVIVAALAGVVGLLANFTDASALKNATDCITQVMVAFGVLEGLSAFAGISSSLGTLAVLAGVVAVLGVVIGLLANLTDTSAVSSIATSLSTLMNSLSVLAVATIAIPSDLGSAVTKAVGLVAVIAAICGVCAALSYLDKYSDTLNTGATVLGGMIGSLVKGIQDGLSGDTDGLEEKGNGLANFIESIQPVIESISSIDSSIVDNASTLASALLAICGAELLDAITSFITGGSNMETFGTELAAFGTAINTFASETEGITSESLSGAISAAEALTDLNEALPKTGGIFQLFTGEHDWSTISEGLADFGTALAGFSDAIGEDDFNAEAIKKSATAASALVEVLEAIPPEGGFLDGILGTSEWSTVGDGLVEFGEAMRDYSSAISGENAIDTNAISSSTSAASALVEVLGVIPETGGFIDKFTGTSNWATISDGLVEFGTALALYSAVVSVASFDADAISASVGAAEQLALLQDKIPSLSGWDKLVGNEQGSWTDISEGLAEFGTALSAFSASALTVDATAVSNAIAASEQLALFQESLGTDGGWWTFFTGNKSTFTDFGDNLTALSSALATFSADTKGIVWDDISTMVDALTGVIDLVDASNDVGGTKNLKTILNNLDEIGTSGIDSYITAISERGSDLQQAGEDAVSAVITGMENASTVFSDGLMTAGETIAMALSLNLVNAFSNNETAIETSINSVITTVADSGAETLSLQVAAYSLAAVALITAVVSGMNSQTSTVSSTASSIGRAGSTALHSSTIYSGFYNSGVYLIAGLAKGIEAGKSSAVNAAVAVGTAALTALNEALDENSPSKKTIESGEYFDEGLAIGIRSMAYVAANAANDVGDTTLSALDTAAKRVNEVLDGRMSFSPTITPVIDLSNVNSGVNAIQGMLGQGYNLDIDTAQISSLSAAMGQIQNGTGNEDVVSAITKLNRTMSKDRQNVYNLGSITYDDSSSVANAVQAIVRAATIERRA